jgi:ribosomal protein L40E
MGLFSNAKESHRRALQEAARIVERYAVKGSKIFDLSTLPIEFRSALYPRLENLRFHVESTTDKELGDRDYLRELGEDLGFCVLLTSGKYSKETQQNFRTAAFEGSVERLSAAVERAGKGLGREPYESPLEDLISEVETTLKWFSDLPTPRSQKYSAAQATTLIALARDAIAKRTPPVQRINEPAPRDECPKCSAANAPDAVFCKRCGAALGARSCRKCGQANDADAAFCNKCGEGLAL